MFDFGIIPPAMFVGMVLFMLYGFPVAFSLAAVGLFVATWAVSAAIWKFGRIEQRWARGGDA